MTNEPLSPMTSPGQVLVSAPAMAPARAFGGGDVIDALGRAYDAAWSAVAPKLLELARLRLSMLLRCTDELDRRTLGVVGGEDHERKIRALPDWPTSPLVSSTERACLRFAEQFVVDVSLITDEDAAAVADVLGDAGLYGFVSALVLIDESQRLQLALAALFDDEEDR